MQKRSEDALIALRQIQRKTEIASKKLAAESGLTPSQLRVIQILKERGEVSTGEIASLTQLKHATITSLVDKLVARGMVERNRCDQDRRKVWLTLTEIGEETIVLAPNLLQDTFHARFSELADWEQTMLVSALERAVSLIEAENLDAAPILDIGALDEKPV